MNNYRFGNYLCDLREKKNLSQKQLGMQLGISNKTISKWENGGGYPSTELILPLAKVLGVGVEEMYTAISNDKQEKTKLRKVIDAIVAKSFLIVSILYGFSAVLWGIYLIFGSSDQKMRISLVSFIAVCIFYGFTRLAFKFFIKNPIAPSKYIDFMVLFITVGFTLSFIMMIVQYFLIFPDGYSPSFAAIVSAYAGMAKSLKKRI